MINPQIFFDELNNNDVVFYTGVPDSLLVNFCNYLGEQFNVIEHISAANEGNAIAIAMGYHLGTGKVPLVYMQNSGLGNCINPLTSLTDAEVYKIPMIMLIGWRGEPGIKDEPQHIKQGRITLEQLELLEIPYFIMDKESDVKLIVNDLLKKIKIINSPVALIVRANTFSEFKSKIKAKNKYVLTREKALERLLKKFAEDDLIIATTGKTSRELFDLRSQFGHKQSDFLTVGGMGHTSSIALGLAITRPMQKVICLDGDGSLIMHMGCLPTISEFKPKNLIHILLNNESHESVGGQPTSARQINFKLLSKAVGYSDYAVARDIKSLDAAWNSLHDKEGPVMLEIKLKKGSRTDLGRPNITTEENKISFMSK
jgi:phosphonopyruvate decarboxylase